MRVATRIDDVRHAVEAEKKRGRVIGFVPTMGALHEGHLSLIRHARERADFVVVSIFVNPTQFGPGEDYEAYPRRLEDDSRLASEAGADLVFAPSAGEMYAPDAMTTVSVARLSEPLCGAGRPGHFDGVALVVSKLLNIVRPDFSVFGQKDAQQAILITRLVRDLHLPGEVLVAPTVRGPDGLALSSRNRYLSRDERKAAPALFRGLLAAERAYEDGDRDAGRLVDRVRREIDKQPLLQAEYVEIRDLDTLDPWKSSERPAVLAAAVRVGRARLIDNVFLGPPGNVSVTSEIGSHGKEDQVREPQAMAIILAAGEGKRMNSALPKVLHEVAGEPLLAHVGRAARNAGFSRIVVVIGKGADAVRTAFASEDWEYVIQSERLGTGDAVRRAREQLEQAEGEIVVLAGDTPLLQSETIRKLREEHRRVGASVTVLTAKLENPHGYGRIVRSPDTGEFLSIVEHKDASEAQREIAEVNSSVYCFNAVALRSVLWRIGADNAQGEIYLTDAVGLLRDEGKTVSAFAAATPAEILGVNTASQLEEIEDILAKRGSAPAEGIR